MNIDRFLDKDNDPLEFITEGAGFCGIFRSIGCIGDSLSSGEFQIKGYDGIDTYHDMYEYSWGQYMARTIGSKVYNFSKGGMTAKDFVDSFGEKTGCFNSENFCQAYIIALGVNDVSSMVSGNLQMGDTSDINKNCYWNNKHTFVGYMASIIQRLKIQTPGAKFFLLTIPKSDVSDDRTPFEDEHAEMMYTLAGFFSDTYVIDLRKYAPVYDSEFQKKFFLSGHMNTCGYILTAKMIISYIDYIIRHNIGEFNNVPFIGTPYFGIAPKQ